MIFKTIIGYYTNPLVVVEEVNFMKLPFGTNFNVNGVVYKYLYSTDKSDFFFDEEKVCIFQVDGLNIELEINGK